MYNADCRNDFKLIATLPQSLSPFGERDAEAIYLILLPVELRRLQSDANPPATVK
jgi:hypothetical protein